MGMAERTDKAHERDRGVRLNRMVILRLRHRRREPSVRAFPVQQVCREQQERLLLAEGRRFVVSFLLLQLLWLFGLHYSYLRRLLRSPLLCPILNLAPLWG